MHLGAQFPILVRGIYYEGWHMAGKPTKDRSVQEFASHVQAGLPPQFSVDPLTVARGVVEILWEKLDPGEFTKVMKHLPEPLRSLGPETTPSSSFGSRHGTRPSFKEMISDCLACVGPAPTVSQQRGPALTIGVPRSLFANQFKRSALLNRPRISSGRSLSHAVGAPSAFHADVWLAELGENVPEA